ncbi:hypothetical protein RclHR1_02700009 [Rhizophagus clarus]|uniref:Uncharacterized protein n=1 Tax=Rhizophagus clarus TaxID=94130 RepID=A0A2Z6R1D8_9GLOM|nr:hypothetical protein RclHR1_02700009 [Rhizophagus clarus]
MSFAEGVLMGGVLQAIHKLGNIGTLSLDEQVARVNTVFGESSITKQVNFQALAANSNLSYGVLMLLFRVSQEVYKETLGCLYFDASAGSFPNLEAAKEQLNKREPMKLDVPEKEIIEITMDQSEMSTSTPLKENATTPKKKKSRKSKKQKKQPEDTTPAEKGKVNQGNTKKEGKKFTRGAAEKVITGHQVPDADLGKVCHLTVYDVPVEWTQEQIIAALATWGNTIKISMKKQRKFQTVWVKILLNDEVRAHYD